MLIYALRFLFFVSSFARYNSSKFGELSINYSYYLFHLYRPEALSYKSDTVHHKVTLISNWYSYYYMITVILWTQIIYYPSTNCRYNVQSKMVMNRYFWTIKGAVHLSFTAPGLKK